MKMNIAIVVALILGVALAFSLSRQDGPKALAVQQVSANPASFPGTIALTGIMGALSKEDPKVFGLMDKKELDCKGANCRKVFVPIRYEGKRPALGDELRMTGSFVVSGPGFLFVAQDMKVVGHHKL